MVPRFRYQPVYGRLVPEVTTYGIELQSSTLE